MKIKQIKIIFWIIAIIAFIVFFIHGNQMDKKATEDFNKEEFHGIIKEIKYNEGKRGFPDILINENWIYLGLNGEKIQNYISIGDSLEKIKGSDIIIVYRKDSLNNWIPKEFK